MISTLPTAPQNPGEEQAGVGHHLRDVLAQLLVGRYAAQQAPRQIVLTQHLAQFSQGARYGLGQLVGLVGNLRGHEHAAAADSAPHDQHYQCNGAVSLSSLMACSCWKGADVPILAAAILVRRTLR